MILLSEVADRIRNEIDSWPTRRKMMVHIHIDPDLHDTRTGNQARLAEALFIPVGIFLETAEGLRIEMTGTDELVHITYYSGNAALFSQLQAVWKRWNPVVGTGDGYITITLNLPVARDAPPVNLKVLADETGFNMEEIRELLAGLTDSVRIHFEILRQETGSTGEWFRAAHSLKGTGRTLRAPEFAAAAGMVEQDIRNCKDFRYNLTRLETSWQKIERWITSAPEERDEK